MKRISAIILTVLLLCSCGGGELVPDTPDTPDQEQKDTIPSQDTTTTEKPDSSDVAIPLMRQELKASFAEEGYDFAAGAELSVFNCWSAQLKYVYSDAGIFKSQEDFLPEGGKAMKTMYAVYPYDASASINVVGRIFLTLPETVSSLIAPVMVANAPADASELVLKRLCGLLPLKFVGTDRKISSFTFEGNAGEKICGPAAVSFSAKGNPSLKMDDAAATVITYECGQEGLSADDATLVYIPLPPVTLENGFAVKVEFADGTVDRTSVFDKVEVTLGQMPAYTISCVRSVTIIGDSYSTFDGWNNRDADGNHNGFAKWYPNLDVQTVDKTWWHQIISQPGYRLERNNSYSGSVVSYNHYGTILVQGDKKSFLGRLGKDCMGDPDIILVFGGTNDSWTPVQQGEYVYSDWTYEQLKTFRPAFACMMSTLKENYPYARIINITNSTGGNGANGRPGISDAAAETMIEVCKHLDITNVVLPEVLDVIGKEKDHPNAKGMEEIFKAVSATLEGKEYIAPELPQPEPGDDKVIWYVDGHAAKVAKPSKSAPSVAPFAYSNSQTQASLVGKSVNRFRMSVAQAGTLTYGKWDLQTTFTELGTLTLSNPSTVPQTFEIPTVTLQEGETFAFHKAGDTGLFYFSNDSASDEQVPSAYFWRLVTGKKAHDNKNLGIDIGYCAE